MKILYFSPHPNIGLHTQSGPGTHIREVIAAFRKEGHEVQTLIMGGKEPAQGQNQTAPPTGLKQRVKPLIPPYLWQSLKDRNLLKFDRYAKQELIQKIQEFQPDLIYERGYYMMTSGVEAAKEMGIKHCLEMNAPYPEEKLEMEGKGIHDRKASHREKQQVESTDLLVVVSSALKDYFLKRTNIDPNRVLVTPNAIRESFMEEGKDQDIRSSLGWGGQTIVGFVGSIFPYHGVDRLLEAFAIANKENTKLLIVGDGAILEQLKERSQNLNIADQVHS
ncbi:MAG: glycosyltransferase, partial [Flavobacteriales bacterium]|nr:glycosyltransferase [Flavobacteriales bacterium]